MIGSTLALTAYRATAEAWGESFEFGHGPLDHLNVPLWAVAVFGADGVLCDGFGYGATLVDAQTSAWGEVAEWVLARQALARLPRRWASYRELQREGTAAVDPVALCLSAGTHYTDDQPITWVEGRAHPSGAPTWLPIEAIAPRQADIGTTPDGLYVPITNGLGAGTSLEHALAHGILEALQRDGNSVQYRAVDRGVAVTLDEVRDPQTRTLLDYLHAQGMEVIVKLATTEFGMANVYVVGYDREPERARFPITLSACGEAVHPDRERALAKAVREFVSARARKAFAHGPLAALRSVAPPGYVAHFRPRSLRNEDDRAFREMRDWMQRSHAEFMAMLGPVFAVRERVAFSSLPTVAPEAVAAPSALLALLTERLAQAELPIFYVPFHAPGSAVFALKAVVAGLEVETMTYHRIGWRNVQRLIDRSLPIAGVGTPPNGAVPIMLRPAAEARLGGPAWFDPQAAERAVGPLYPLYREPGRHVLALTNMEQRQAPADESAG